MSWVVDAWKDGLPGKALQKIQEIEGQLDKLKKERTQKQFQLDSLEAALQKQKQKVDSEKSEASALKREHQSLLESCDSLEKARQRATHDLGVKEQQVNYLEGQLNSSKKTIDRLEQELKKHKNEFDRSQPSSDLQPYSTPQKTFATPAATPSYRQHDSRLEDLQEKYYQEVEERKRLEAELKVMQVKLLNQSSVSHKDIAARQQAGSSVFPWQQQSQSRQSQGAMETPSKKRGGGLSASGFLWNVEDTPVEQSQRISAAVSQSADSGGSSQQMEQLRTLNQELRFKVSELEQRVASQEKDMKAQSCRLQEMQGQLDQARKELTERDKTLGKTRDELSKATAQQEQAVTKCASVEQKLKQVSEEMSCQRHNAESCKRALEQKVKDQDKESQKELARLQSTHQALDQQFNQSKIKLNQEIQQAKNEYNVMQSEMEKVTSQRSKFERDLEEQKQKLFRSEQELQSSKTKEQDTRKKFEELQKENNTLSSQLEQGRRRLSQLEEERKSSEQNLKRSQSMVDDFKAKTEAQGEELKGLRAKLESQSRSSAQDLENQKKTLSDLEAKNERSQGELQKQKQEIEQMTIKQSALGKENEDLRATLTTAQNECVELRKEYETLLGWKTEKETLINDTETVQRGMTDRIGELEKSLAALIDDHSGLKGQLKTLEDVKAGLSGQIDALKGELLNKCTDLEEKERLYEELQKQSAEADQKHSKDLENVGLQVTQLEGQVKDLTARLKQETSRADVTERSLSELQEQYQAVCDLALSKDSLIELGQTEIADLRDSLTQATTQQEQQQVRFTEDKSTLLRECEESVAAKAEEAEQVKLSLLKVQQELPLLQDQVTSLESALEIQKFLGVELRSKYDNLVKTNEDLQKMLSEAEKAMEGLQSEIDTLSELSKTAITLQEQCDTLTAAEENNRNTIQSMTETLTQAENDLQTLRARAGELETQVSKAETKATDLEKKNVEFAEKAQEMQKEAEEVSMKYQSNQDSQDKERTGLLEQISTLRDVLAEREAVAETLPALKIELETANQVCADLKNSLDTLENSHTAAVELSSNLENSLVKKTEEIKDLSEKFSKESESHVSEMKNCLQKQKSLKELLDTVKGQFEVKCKEAAEAKEMWENASLELSKLREDVVSGNCKLKAVNEAYNLVCQEIESWKQAASTHQKEMEEMKTALSDAGNSIEQKDHKIKNLRERLNQAESEEAKAVDALKEKVISMNKIKVQLEMLQMDLEDNEACMNSFDSQVEDLRGTIATLEGGLEERETQRSTLETELGSVKEELSIKSCEVTQLMADLEAAHKQEQASSASAALVESLQATVDGLIETLEEEVSKRSSLEADIAQHEANLSQLAEEKLQLEGDLQRHGLHTQDEVNAAKQENENLQCTLQSITEEYELLKAAFETATQQSEETKVKNAEFEREQAEPYQRLAGLQSELAQLKEQYNSLLAQVAQQQCLIEQLQSQSEREKEVSTEPAAEPSDVINNSMEELSVEEQLRVKSEDLEELSHAFEEAVRTLEEEREDQRQTLVEERNMLAQALENEKQARGCDLAEDKERQSQAYADELSELRTSLSLLQNEMTLRKELCSELEVKVSQLEIKVQMTEEERCGSVEKLSAALVERRVLTDQLSELTEETDSLRLELQTSKCQLSDVMEMLETLEVAKGGWDDRFFQIECELKRVRSEKANLEKHILSMEADLEGMHEHKLSLEGEVEAHRRANASLEKQLETLSTEIGQLRTEMLSCTEERDELSQSLHLWRDKTESLEKTNVDTRELIKILEEDIRNGKKEYETAASSIESLQKEKEQIMQQFQVQEQAIALQGVEKAELLNEFNQFKDDKNAASRDSESMLTKILSLEGEISRLAQSLESSLLEKGEIASRLNSTQDEVKQMRSGIEKLQVRIESDEGKKKHMSALLKAAQRKADSLQDKIDKLEREGEMSEQSIEEAVVQAEMAKAELEKLEEEKGQLSTKIEEMTAELDSLRTEKEKLERELALKNASIEELKAANQASTRELERWMREAEERQQSVVEELQAQVSSASSKLQTCRGDLEASRQREQGLGMEVEQLQGKMEEKEKEGEVMCSLAVEWEKERGRLQYSVDEWKNEGERLETDRGKLEEERDMLQTLAKARGEESERLGNEKERWEHDRETLAEEKKALQTTLSSLEKEREKLEEENTRLMEERQTLQSSIVSLETSTQQLQEQLETSTLTISQLTDKVNALQESNAQLQSDLEGSASEAGRFREASERETASLTSRLQEQAESYKLSLEEVTSEKEVLNSQLVCTQENENKEKQQLSELNSRVARLSKERDSALSKMNLWMNSCKQLEKEKQALVQETHQQGELITKLQTSQTAVADAGSGEEAQAQLEEAQAQLEELRRALEEREKEVEELSLALEDRSCEADESVDKYCSLMVRVHKLEETNDALKTRLEQINANGSVTPNRKGRKSAARAQEAVAAAAAAPAPAPAPAPPQAENDENNAPSALGKRARAAGGDSTPAKAQEALHNVAKRIKAGAVATTPKPGSGQEEDEFKPEGLPELVQRGFADIPLGEASPFILRRTTVQRCSPRLAARQAAVPPTTPTQCEPDCPKTPADNSRLQKVLEPLSFQSSVGTVTPLSDSPSVPRGSCRSPAPSCEEKRGRRSLSTRKTPEQREKRREAVSAARQGEENCHVQ